MFFRNDFQEPPPDTDQAPPEKTGAARFFEILQGECGNLIKINLFFLLTCLPLITIPPAVYALNQVVHSMVLDQSVHGFSHYWSAFRQHLRQAYISFFLMAVPLFLSPSFHVLLHGISGNTSGLCLLVRNPFYRCRFSLLPAPVPGTGFRSSLPSPCGSCFLLWLDSGGSLGVSFESGLSPAHRLFPALPAEPFLYPHSYPTILRRQSPHLKYASRLPASSDSI